MAEFKTISIDQIVVPERLRAVEEDHALAIAQSIVEHGLLNPITVRSTRAAKGGNYTLVAGAHRLRAMVLNDESEIKAMVVEADKAEAQLLEITENLFRNELSVIDRAIFVRSYRDVWEQKYGQITPGGDQKSKRQVVALVGDRANLALLFQEEAGQGFSEHVAERLGFSKRSIERLNRIAQSLSPALRTALRGTPAADNQSLLLKLAKAGPSKQAGIVAGLEKEPDIKKVLAWAKDPAPPISEADKQAIVLHQLKTAWKGAGEATRQRFLQSIGLVDDVQEAAQRASGTLPSSTFSPSRFSRCAMGQSRSISIATAPRSNGRWLAPFVNATMTGPPLPLAWLTISACLMSAKPR